MPPRASNSERLHVLSEIVACRLDELLVELGVDLRRQGRILAGPCPVHGGDNPGACNIYPDGYSMRGNWYCRTRHCERVFHKTIIGFVRGVLSNRRGYTGESGDPVVSFKDTLNFLCDFVGQDFDELHLDHAEFEKKRFVASMEAMGLRREEKPAGWPETLIRSRMHCPSRYYLDRGYSAEILTRFGVGEWTNPDPEGEMFGRVVVPVFDQEGKWVVGVSGRSLYPRCAKCRSYHDPSHPCPQGEKARLATKWRHNSGFQTRSHLYNLWGAKQTIRKTHSVVLVESPGNVWRLVEAGVDNCVAQFGSTLEDEQQILLETAGVLTVYLGMDQDQAGREATRLLQEQLGRAFHVKEIEGIQDDIGAMSVEEVKTILVPQMR